MGCAATLCGRLSAVPAVAPVCGTAGSHSPGWSGCGRPCTQRDQPGSSPHSPPSPLPSRNSHMYISLDTHIQYTLVLIKSMYYTHLYFVTFSQFSTLLYDKQHSNKEDERGEVDM